MRWSPRRTTPTSCGRSVIWVLGARSGRPKKDACRRKVNQGKGQRGGPRVNRRLDALQWSGLQCRARSDHRLGALVQRVLGHRSRHDHGGGGGPLRRQTRQGRRPALPLRQPQVVSDGASTDQRLFSQHNAHWIAPVFPERVISWFSTTAIADRAETTSSVDEIVPPLNSNGTYDRNRRERLWSRQACRGATRLPRNRTSSRC